MSRLFTPLTLSILENLDKNPETSSQKLWKNFRGACTYKEFYNTIFRLSEMDLITKQKQDDGLHVTLTEEGKKILKRNKPERDGIWKIIIFDIPEKHKQVRVVLRAKLKTLHFKKWQNSIWVSPFALDTEIQEELKMLGGKFFIRLIKTKDINITDDLTKLFP